MTRPNPELYLENLNTPTVENLIKRRAPLFLPVGTLEAHGRHLPVGTDTLCALGVAESLAGHFQGAVAPPLPYGLTNLLAQTAPASFFPEEVYQSFVSAILSAFLKHGFQKIVIVNGHGGNMLPLKEVARRLIRDHQAAISVVHWWLLSQEAAKANYGAEGGHAAVEETAAILYFHPDLVQKKNYAPQNDDCYPEEGLWCYPPAGEVLMYGPRGKGQPDFDPSRARIFMSQVLEGIQRRLQAWFQALGRLESGLRGNP